MAAPIQTTGPQAYIEQSELSPEAQELYDRLKSAWQKAMQEALESAKNGGSLDVKV